jgi:hypothetical protein
MSSALGRVPSHISVPKSKLRSQCWLSMRTADSQVGDAGDTDRKATQVAIFVPALPVAEFFQPLKWASTLGEGAAWPSPSRPEAFSP